MRNFENYFEPPQESVKTRKDLKMIRFRTCNKQSVFKLKRFTMKNLLLTVYFSLSLCAGFTQTQTITFSFQGEDAQTANSVALQSVFIKNQTLDCDTTIYGNNPLITLDYFVGIGEISQGYIEPFTVMSPLPNPFAGSTFVNINLTKKGNLHLCLTNEQGKKITDLSNDFPAGLHKFEITTSSHNLLILNVSNGTFSKSVKLINISAGAESTGIRYAGSEKEILNKTTKLKGTSGFTYNLGDQMLFTANASGYNEQTIEDTPLQSTAYTFEMTPLPLVDGYYIKGSTTACPELNLNGLMKITRNEVNQTLREELKELYIPIQAGPDGFSIVRLIGSDTVIFGPGVNFGIVTDPEPDGPQVPFQRGEFTETTTKFTVPEDGMYHVALDTEARKIVIVPVSYWGIIGSATPGGWGYDTQMPPLAFDLNSMTFEVNEVNLIHGEWKFRYSGGWKVIIDPDFYVGGGVIGIKVNTNFGGAVDALVPGGANIYNEILGVYTVMMSWNLGQAYAATLIKTGEIPTYDYSDTELGLVGDGLIVNGIQHNWDETVMLQTPVVENETNYIWTYLNVEVTTAGSFKIREGQTWAGISIGYNGVIMAGLSANDFGTNGDGNFVPLQNGFYDMELFIDAITEIYTLTVNPAGFEPELYILGDGTPAGWDNTAAMPMNGTNGYYFITLEIPGGGYIKFLEVLGQWAPQYGTDEYGTSTGGNLVYRPTESYPDPPAIPAPLLAGSYAIIANTNDLTYSITLTK
jgi:hypothetical protein